MGSSAIAELHQSVRNH